MWIKQKGPKWLLTLTVTLVFTVGIWIASSPFLPLLERWFFDLRAKIAAAGEAGLSDIQIVEIGEEDLTKFGPLPWSRGLFATAVRNLDRAEAKVIVLDIILAEPETSPGLRAVRRLKEQYESAGLAQEGPGLAFYRKLSRTVKDLDNDKKLYDAMETAGNVAIPVKLVRQRGGETGVLPEFFMKHTVSRAVSLEASEPLFAPAEDMPGLFQFAEVAGALGHVNFRSGLDRKIRSIPHLLPCSEGAYFPSLPIAVTALYEGVGREGIGVVPGEGIYMDKGSGKLKVPFNASRMHTLLNRREWPESHRSSFSEVINPGPGTIAFKDKVVIVGKTADLAAHGVDSPASETLSRIEIVAGSVASILSQDFIARPGWVHFMEWLILAFSALLVILGLTRTDAGSGALIVLVVVMGYAALGMLLMIFGNSWLKVSFPALLLAAGYFLLIALRHISGHAEGPRPSPTVSSGSRSIERLTSMVYEILGLGRSDRAGRRRRSKGMSNLKDNMVGRYRVLAEVDRGAVGVVHKAEDTKTGHIVALKTISLREFQDKAGGRGVEEDFFEQAKLAGSLKHPNIVGVFGWGEASGLVYIAMELLDGVNLKPRTREGSLFTARETLSVVSGVAEALDYAHGEGMVHRDIKPANIMWCRREGSIKVTDFGTDYVLYASRIRRGAVFGTPFYMSPEQVAGKRVDGRSDIFSLGVVLFELLTGQKPFTGGDLMSLMFDIARKPHPRVKDINPRMPRVVQDILDKALEKDLKRRYQKAGEMSRHLRRVIARIDELKARKS